MRHSRWALAVSLLLNVSFLIVLHIGTRPQAPMPTTRSDRALQVRLIDITPVALPDEPVPPPVPATPVAPAKPRVRRAREAPNAAAVPADRAADEFVSQQPDRSAKMRLYDMDGRLRLPEPTKDAGPVPFPANPRALADGDAFARRNTVPYEPTRFESVWAPRDETLGGEILRKLTVERSWLTPWGTQINCTWILVLGGCSWGSPPTMTIEELKAMRADPPILRHPYVDPPPAQ